MIAPPLTAEAARRVLDAVIRTELWKAYERGMDAAPHGVNTLNDPGAPKSFDAITEAVDDYVGATFHGRLDQLRKVPTPADGETTAPAVLEHTSTDTDSGLTPRLTTVNMSNLLARPVEADPDGKQ